MASSPSHIHGPAGLREVTEDTPPDLLEGTMDIIVALPSKKNVRMTVSRRTPILDLIIHVTTANKINPAGHTAKVRNEIGRELKHNPSTPIGALDARTIEIVPKHEVNDYILAKSKQSVKLSSQPIEATFRLEVYLPKNQLHVIRVSPRIFLQEILEEVCREKELDISKYEIRHPVNLDQKLSLTNRLGDYSLKQVRVVSKNSQISSSVSSADILALQIKTNGRGSQGHLDSVFNYSRSSVGESSLSSGSAASARGASPCRSDDSRSISPPIGILPSKIKLKSSVSNVGTTLPAIQAAMLKKSISSNPLPGFSGSRTDLSSSKKKRAPLPPPLLQHKLLSQSLSQPLTSDLTSPDLTPGGGQVIRKKEVMAPSPPITSVVSASRSRQSSASDSSGYHEASASSILSDQQQEMIRKDRAIAAVRKVGTGSLSSLNNPLPAIGGKSLEMSTSTTNLTSAFSVSTTSISSTGSKTKRKAPKPPTTPLQSPLEEELPALPPASAQQKPTAQAQEIVLEKQREELTPSSVEAALERKPVEVQVEVHSAAIPSATEQTEIEEEQRNDLSQSSNKSSDTLKYMDPSSQIVGAVSASSSKSGSTLTKSESSESRSSSGSRSSLGSQPPSPLPAEEVPGPLLSSREASPPLSPPSPTTDGDKHEEASSGSEASYADSGLPLTATVTPSPVSLEPEGQEHHSDKSLTSSRRSSIHSSGSDDHSECWRELLEAKIEDGQVSMIDKTPESNFPGRVTQSAPVLSADQNTNERQNASILPSMGHDENEQDGEIEKIKKAMGQPAPPVESPTPPPAEPPAPQVIPKSSPSKISDSSQPSSEAEEDTAIAVTKQQKKRDSWSSTGSASSATPKKSESFSYKGEFDMKKRRSSASGGNAVQRRSASKVISYTSSSEEEEMRRSEKKAKSVSMQNLSKKEKGREWNGGVSGGQGLKMTAVQIPLEAEKVVKATSLASLRNLSVGSTDGVAELGNDPKLMETFQVELEQQFEQWKEQFLQRHLGAVQRSPPMEHRVDPPQQKTDVAPNQLKATSSSSDSSDSEGAVFDPEVPQAVHSVGIGKEAVESPVTEEPEQNVTPPAEPKIEIQTTIPTEHHSKTEPVMNGVEEVKLRQKPTQAQPSAVYRYSGPPAINMGTWGERTKRSPIAVKEDNDYIMGMGQNEAKTPTVASRVHGFTGVPPVAVTSFPTKRTDTKSPVSANTRWSNVEVRSIDSGKSAGVITTWKQRIDDNEKARSSGSPSPTSSDTEPKSVSAKNTGTEGRSVSATNTLERPRSTLNKTSFTISSATNTLERPIGKRTPSPLFTSEPTTKTGIAPATAAIPKEIVIEESLKRPAPVLKKSLIDISDSKPESSTKVFGTFDGGDLNEKISMEDKKRFFQGTRAELPGKEVNGSVPRGIQVKTTTYAESKKSAIREDNAEAKKSAIKEDSVDSSRSASSCSSFGSFDGSRPNSVSLEEKKRFFQGVKPAESPTREVPVPAVNMKSSIATIQRVFEQHGNRNLLQKSISTTSLASDSGSSKVTSPSPSATPSPYGTINKHPTDFMVSQVIKGKNFDSIRRTPSPATPDATQTQTDASVKISTGSNIQTHGNKAVIVVGSEVNDPPKTSVGDAYRQHLKINNSGSTNGGGATVKVSINGISANAADKSLPKKPSMVLLNGNSAEKVTPPVSKVPPPPPMVNKSNSGIVIEEIKKPAPKSKILEMQSLLAQQNFQPRIAQAPPAQPKVAEVRSTTLNGVGGAESSSAKIPAPPPAPSMSKNRSESISSVSSSDSGSAPPTPSSPMEARAGILSAIKNSGGNFALKKTRSSVLLN